MTLPPELDDKTLALLIAVSNLCGNSDGTSHIVGVFEKSMQKAKEYRAEPETIYEPRRR
jgi:hypothetical protein